MGVEGLLDGTLPGSSVGLYAVFDALDRPLRMLLLEVTNRMLNSSAYGRCIYLSLRKPSGELRSLEEKLSSKLLVVDGFSDRRGWYQTTPTQTQTQTQTPSAMQTQTGASRVAWTSSNDIASLQSVLEQCLSTLGALAPLPLVIDSLSDLAAAHSMDALCDFFFSLRTRLPGIGPIFALIHEDVHTPAEIKTLQYCCNGFIGLNAQSTAYECITKRKSGKITREPVPSSLAPLPVRMPSGPTSTPVATAKPVSNTPPIPTAGPTPVDPTQDLTFNLRLTDEQRRAKNSMVLPYEHQDVNKEWGAFQIENEEEDDEQDPDDDLDV